MYCRHFGLQRPPFAITPDPGFAYASRAQREALNTLVLTTDAGEGFVKITGAVGTGKTLLCRRFLAVLAGTDPGGRRFRTVYLPNPCLSPQALLRAIAADLKLRLPDAAHAGADDGLLEALTRTLLRLARRGERLVVCLDEAQAMPPETLEALRLLSNLETGQSKLLQIVLFGQPELDALLARPVLQPLRSRIAFAYHLQRLDREETAAYVMHRLGAAGHRGGELFTPAALRALHRASGGLPRRINILAHKGLLVAYGEGAAMVGSRHVRTARIDTPAADAVAGFWAGLSGVYRGLLQTVQAGRRSLAWARAAALTGNAP